MNYLLDTKVFLWMQVHPHKLGANTLTILRDDRHQLHLSAESTWEIALKFRRGQLTLPHPPDEYVPDRMLASGVTSLAIEPSHTLAVAGIDGRNRDLIDRLLIGQAMVENMALITAVTDTRGCPHRTHLLLINHPPTAAPVRRCH